MILYCTALMNTDMLDNTLSTREFLKYSISDILMIDNLNSTWFISIKLNQNVPDEIEIYFAFYSKPECIVSQGNFCVLSCRRQVVVHSKSNGQLLKDCALKYFT